MNEATADNNGVYLLDGHHGNGCRQREGERERQSSSIALRSVDPYTGDPLCLTVTFSIIYRRTVLFTLNILASSQRTLCSDICVNKDGPCQIKVWPEHQLLERAEQGVACSSLQLDRTRQYVHYVHSHGVNSHDICNLQHTHGKAYPF